MLSLITRVAPLLGGILLHIQLTPLHIHSTPYMPYMVMLTRTLGNQSFIKGGMCLKNNNITKRKCITIDSDKAL